jgi:diguanylate cyclase (GGDEF)-like protein
MRNSSLYFYARLTRRIPKSYRAKFVLLVVVVQGLLVLFALLYLGFLGSAANAQTWQFFWLTTGAVLIATLLLLWGISALLAPLFVTADSLKKYLNQHVLPTLPTQYTDTAGQLMSDVQYVVTELDRRATQFDDSALMDHLTQTLTRGVSEKRLRQEIEYAVLHLQPFVLALLDLDHFKEINDHYGLAVGDQCIRHVGKVIRAHTRKHDWIGRWGGDEFILVLHKLEPQKIEPTLKRLNEAIQSTPIPDLPQDLHLMISLSVGATILRPGDTPEALLAKAESALYQSKAQGRGKVTILDERVNAPTKRAPREK